jgi:hypothetical protein
MKTPSDFHTLRIGFESLQLRNFIPMKKLRQDGASPDYEESGARQRQTAGLPAVERLGPSFNLLQESGLIPFRCSCTVDPMGYRDGERRHKEVFFDW